MVSNRMAVITLNVRMIIVVIKIIFLFNKVCIISTVNRINILWSNSTGIFLFILFCAHNNHLWVVCHEAGAHGRTHFSLTKQTGEERCMLSSVGNVLMCWSPKYAVNPRKVVRFVSSRFWWKKLPSWQHCSRTSLDHSRVHAGCSQWGGGPALQWLR